MLCSICPFSPLACFKEGKRLHDAAVGVELRVQPGRVEPAETEVRRHDPVPLAHLRPAVFGDGPQLFVVVVGGGGGDDDMLLLRIEKATSEGGKQARGHGVSLACAPRMAA